MEVYLNSVGLIAPGLMGWKASLPVLTEKEPYSRQEMPRLVPSKLPPNERRRASATIKLVMLACEDAMETSPIPANEVSAVFSSSEGDLELMGSICSRLTAASPVLSPFEFHNSVHNAPAGYWAIGTGSHKPSVSVCGFDASFSCGLIEAAVLVSVEQTPTLLASYDHVPPPPILDARPVLAPFAATFVLTPQPTGSDIARLTVAISDSPAPDEEIRDPGLEELRMGNAAARCLPLLMAIAGQKWGPLSLPYLNERSLHLELASP